MKTKAKSKSSKATAKLVNKVEAAIPSSPVDKRRIALVAILGTSPAVVTEAVWALAHREHVVPDEVVVLTTRSGQRNLESQMKIDAGGGDWDALKADIGSTGLDIHGKLRFRVELFKGEDGRETEDLPTEKANLLAADMMMKELRQFTDDDGWVVYGLLAGGRKTMSALFFSCMCLLGRRDDRVYHVLVTPGYDSRTPLDPPFSFPKPGVVHKGKRRMEKPVNGKTEEKVELESEKCEINLFSVPFATMGEWVQKKCKGKRLSYTNLIDAVGRSFDDALTDDIVVDFEQGAVLVNGKSVNLDAASFALFVYLAQGMSEDEALRHLTHFQDHFADPLDGEFIPEGFKDLIWRGTQTYYRANEFKEKRKAYDKENNGQIAWKTAWKKLIHRDLAKAKSALKCNLSASLFERLTHGKITKKDVRFEWGSIPECSARKYIDSPQPLPDKYIDMVVGLEPMEDVWY